MLKQKDLPVVWLQILKPKEQIDLQQVHLFHSSNPFTGTNERNKLTCV